MSDIIKSMLCLSTAHLKPETFQKLEHDKIDACIYYKKIDVTSGEYYGGWLYISDDGSPDDINKNEDLKAVVDYCDEHNIEWVMFDADEDESTDLPVYTDEWVAYAKEMLGDMLIEQ